MRGHMRVCAMLFCLAALQVMPPTWVVGPRCVFAARQKRGKVGERFVNKVTPAIRKEIDRTIQRIFPLAGVNPRDVRVLESTHYLVLTNSPQVDTQYPDALEKVYNFVKNEYRFRPIPGFLKAVVFANKAQYVAYAAERLKIPVTDARHTDGVAIGDTYCTFHSPNALRLLVHEATHQIVYTRLGITGGGSWLHEGLAVYIEKRFLGLNPSAQMRERIAEDRYYYFADFITLKNLLFDPKGYGYLNYEQAGSIVDFMVNGSFRQRFESYLKLVRANQNPDPQVAIKAIEKAFRADLYRFENAWRRFCGGANRGKMPDGR